MDSGLSEEIDRIRVANPQICLIRVRLKFDTPRYIGMPYAFRMGKIAAVRPDFRAELQQPAWEFVKFSLNRKLRQKGDVNLDTQISP